MRRPDFSGEWTLNREASQLAPIVAASVRGAVLRIQHREPTVALHLTVVTDGKPFEARFERLSDGREVTQMYDGGASVGTLSWDGEALVFRDSTRGPGGDVTVSFRYELQEGGRRLRALEQVRGGGRDQDNVWVFERTER